MRIGPYEVLEEIGRGGVGTVYRAHDPGTERVVAIKLLLPGRVRPHLRTRFLREAKALAKVNHPNVVRIWDAGEHDSTPYLVLSYHPHGSLRKRLNTAGPLPIPDAIRVGVQLCEGLEAVHSAGLLHRDLKPDNVLLAGDVAILTDFGLAKDLTREGETEALTTSGALQGSPGFWAPEQAMGTLPLVDARTDVYGLGAVLYAALSGRPPITSGTLLESLAATVAQRPDPLRASRKEVPPALDALIARCLEKDPLSRFQSAAEVREALLSCLEAPPPPSLRGWILVAGFAAGACGIAFAGLKGRQPLPRPSAATPAPTQSAPDAPDPDPAALVARGRAARDEGRLAEALALFQQAAEAGSPEGMNALGVVYLGDTQEPATALKWFRRAATAGYAPAMQNLGHMHLRGLGIPKDEALAAGWYRRGAEAGHPPAMFNFGIMLETGQGLPRDDPLAIQWQRRSATGGFAKAMTSLGTRYLKGRGVPKDEAQGLAWLRRAADKGNADAMFNMGLCLSLGKGVAKDWNKAVEWHQRAAAQDHLGGIHELALLYKKGAGGPDGDRRALDLYRRGVALADPYCMHRLGRMLERGEGCPPDPAAAAGWQRRAAEKGYGWAMYQLGLHLANGVGVSVDKAQAREWLRRAARDPSQKVRLAAEAALEQLGSP